MAQIRSYTTIEQSKKLAEILPTESADMHYIKHSLENFYSPIPFIGKYSKIQDEIPCWSLSALLAILPVNIEYKGKSLRLRLDLGEKDFNVWYDNTDVGGASDIDVLADNPIDACYEMIIKLKEQNLL